MSSFYDNDFFSLLPLYPYGWDYDWVTVDVKRSGEFADTYLTQNNNDWNAAPYLKVTGDISQYDLSAFKNIQTLMKLDLTDTQITELPSKFLRGHKQLLEVKLPSSVAEIGYMAFYDCSALTSVEANGLNYINASAFSGCTSLTSINLTGVKNIDVHAFSDCWNLDKIDLSTVSVIGRKAFSDCKALSSVDLSSATAIGVNEDNNYSNSGCFDGCTALKRVNFGDNLQEVGSNAFSNTAIESIVIPESMVELADQVFEYCIYLTSVELPSSLISIGFSTFRYTSLPYIEIKDGVTEIKSYAFSNCPVLEEVILPATLKRIDPYAFENTNVKNLKCFSVVPPTALSDVFGEEVDLSYTYLYVPYFSKEAYRNDYFWKKFPLIRSLEETVDYMHIDDSIEIFLEKEDVAMSHPSVDLTWNHYKDDNYYYSWDYYSVGQLSISGETNFSVSQFNINATLASRNNSDEQYCPTLINDLPQMRADNVSHTVTFVDNYYNKGKWHFLSLPYDVKVSDIIADNNTYWVVRRYDSAARAASESSETWVDMKKSDVMEAGKGYIISAVSVSDPDEYGYAETKDPCITFTSGNSTTKNNIFRNNDVAVPLTEYSSEFSHNRSWNLMGNPYPCYFNMAYLNDNFSAPITVWNGSAYVAYSPVDDDFVLSPYEAFFVQCPVGISEMVFNKDGRLHSKAGKESYKAPIKTSKDVSVTERNVFNFVVSGSNYMDRARIVLTSNATVDYEIGRDASKFFAEGDAIQIYVCADVNYSINERPIGDGTALLGLRASKETPCTMSLNGKFSSEWHVVLTDNLTGIITDLTKEDYTFITTKEDNSNRFTVQFITEDGGQTGVDSIIEEFGKDSEVTVKALNGITVYTGPLSSLNVPNAGIYLVSNGKEIRKVILK